MNPQARGDLLDPYAGPARVHVVSGSFGAGHDAAAGQLAACLTEAGHLVTRWDVVELFPGRLGPLFRWLYLTQLSVTPRSWGALLRLLRPGRPVFRLAARLVSLAGRRLREIDAAGADLFVSTHPFASQALGRLRAAGRLRAPAVTYLTDLSVHPLWVHRGVDLHLALHDVAAAQAAAWGGRVTVVRPLVPAPTVALGAGASWRWAVRAELGLGPDESMALVVGGSLGIGDLEASALDVLATGLAVPVVLCGTNVGLRKRLGGHPGVRALGWRDDLPALLAVADCVVQNAGGFMSLESLAAGVPVISHRCIPGHGTTNAAALEEAGLAPWAHGTPELGVLIAAALQGERLPGRWPDATVMDALGARVALPTPA